MSPTEQVMTLLADGVPLALLFDLSGLGATSTEIMLEEQTREDVIVDQAQRPVLSRQIVCDQRFPDFELAR